MNTFEMEIFLRQIYGLGYGRLVITAGWDPAGMVRAEYFTEGRLRVMAVVAGYGLCILRKALEEDLGSNAFIYGEVLDLFMERLHKVNSLQDLAEVLTQARHHVFEVAYKVEFGVISRR